MEKHTTVFEYLINEIISAFQKKGPDAKVKDVLEDPAVEQAAQAVAQDEQPTQTGGANYLPQGEYQPPPGKTEMSPKFSFDSDAMGPMDTYTTQGSTPGQWDKRGTGGIDNLINGFQGNTDQVNDPGAFARQANRLNVSQLNAILARQNMQRGGKPLGGVYNMGR